MGREEGEYFQFSPCLTWRGSCVMWERRGRSSIPRNLSLCRAPHSAHPPFSSQNPPLKHPLHMHFLKSGLKLENTVLLPSPNYPSKSLISWFFILTLAQPDSYCACHLSVAWLMYGGFPCSLLPSSDVALGACQCQELHLPLQSWQEEGILHNSFPGCQLSLLFSFQHAWLIWCDPKEALCSAWEAGLPGGQTGVMWALLSCLNPVEEEASTFTCCLFFQDYLRNHLCWTSRGSFLWWPLPEQLIGVLQLQAIIFLGKF